VSSAISGETNEPATLKTPVTTDSKVAPATSISTILFLGKRLKNLSG